MLLEIELLKNNNNNNNNKQTTKTKQNKIKKKFTKNQNCIKSGLSQFLFLQQKM